MGAEAYTQVFFVFSGAYAEEVHALSESVWATDLGGGLYRVENCPMLTPQVGYRDVVAGRTDDDGRVRAHEVVERAGYVSWFVAFPHDSDGTPTAALDEQRSVVESVAYYNGSYVEGLRPGGWMVAVPVSEAGKARVWVERFAAQGRIEYEQTSSPGLPAGPIPGVVPAGCGGA